MIYENSLVYFKIKNNILNWLHVILWVIKNNFAIIIFVFKPVHVGLYRKWTISHADDKFIFPSHKY